MGRYRYGTPEGGHTIPTKRYGTTHEPCDKLSLLLLAYYLNRLNLPLGLHNIPYPAIEQGAS